MALVADHHTDNAFVPSLDHAALAELEADRLVARVRVVEDGAVGLEPAGVVDPDGVAALRGHRLGLFLGLDDGQARFGRALLAAGRLRGGRGLGGGSSGDDTDDSGGRNHGSGNNGD